jgi:peptidase C39, bacteriocin processing
MPTRPDSLAETEHVALPTNTESRTDENSTRNVTHSNTKEKPIPLPPKRKQPLPGPDGAMLSTRTVQGLVPVNNWKRLRDTQIVKQDQDYSCGAASLATLLNSFYRQNLTEEQLLKAMDKGDAQASFDDMVRALPHFGFRAQGFAASWEQLTRLKMPVIVYVKYRKDDHFSVLRGINGNTVWLADPSLGNRTFSRQQFLEMWQTRQDKNAPALSGKFLAVLPSTQDIKPTTHYFSKAPVRQSANAVGQLAFRERP